MGLVEEDPDEPEGFEFVDDCPDVRCKKTMVGSKIMFRWDCGWAHGVIKRRHTKGEMYNWFVSYPEDDGSFSQYRHSLKVANYYNPENSPEGLWVMLREEPK